MTLPLKTASLLRIFVEESQRWEHKPLYEAIVLKAKEMHLAGATVLRGIMGYGATKHLHTTKILDLSIDLPIIIEIIDTEEKIHAFLPHVQSLASNGLITVEEVRFLTLHANGSN